MSTNPDLNELLAEIRKAIGVDAHPEKPIGIHRTGRVKFASGSAIEICGFFETWLSTEGKFRRSVDTVGNLHFDCVFDIDYDASWELSHPADESHLMKRPDWEDRMSELYLYSYGWLTDSNLKGVVRFESTDDAGNYWFAVQPDGGTEMQVGVDASTMLPYEVQYMPARDARKEEKALADNYTVRALSHHTGTVFGTPADRGIELKLEDWRAVDGIKFPHRITRRIEHQYRTYIAESVEVSTEPFNKDVFENPIAHEDPDVRFPQETNKVSMPFRLANNIVCLDVMINGKGPFNFGLDTGTSGSVLHYRVAEQLGVKTRCRFGGNMGGGKRRSNIDVAEGVHLSAGDLHYHNHNIMVIDLDGLAHRDLGEQVDGVLGGTFLQNLIVDIDYPNRSVTFMKPNSIDLGQLDGEVVPITIGGGVPFVEATISVAGKTLDALLMVDNGTRLPLMLTYPFCETNKLDDAAGKVLPMRGFGLGGMFNYAAARLPRLSVGELKLDSVIAGLAQTKVGSLGSTNFSGFLGAGILSRTRVIFDYGNGQMFLATTPAMDKPFEFDSSGLVLVTSEQSYKDIDIAWVMENSPGAEGGLREHDRIDSVNGRLASEIGLPDLHELCCTPDESLTFEVNRDGEKVKKSLRTRRLI